MNMMQPISVLSAATDVGGYLSIWKILVVLVVVFLWCQATVWVDRDTDVVKTQRERWNMIVLSGAAVGFLWLFVPPWEGGKFYLGIGGFALIAGGPILGYVVHRNSRVTPANRILTPAHAKRLIAREGGGAAMPKSHKGVRVTLSNHEGDFVEPPSDPEELKAFDQAQDFLYDVLWRRASEVDLVPGKERYRMLLKIDGVATEDSDGVDPEEAEALIRFLKTHAGLNLEEVRRPQTGRITAKLLAEDKDHGHTEVITSGTTAGERLRLRVQSGPVLMRLHEIGIAEPRLEHVKGFLGKKNGLVILSAPKEHGLTTTEYAIIKSHDAYINNIHALEREVLVEVDNITQQVFEGTNKDVDHARMLQSVLRREPDIVLVAECDDRDTARVATQVAADDRKIYLGMHAKDSFSALRRYLAWVEDNKLVAKSLLGVVNQRLVRVLCTECREAFLPDPATLKKLNLPADKIERFYRPPTGEQTTKRGKPVVCQNCRGSGYLGRTGVFEVLVVDDAVRKLIAGGAPLEHVKAECRKKKMLYLQEEGLLKVIEGTTSMQEVLRCLKVDE